MQQPATDRHSNSQQISGDESGTIRSNAGSQNVHVLEEETAETGLRPNTPLPGFQGSRDAGVLNNESITESQNSLNTVSL